MTVATLGLVGALEGAGRLLLPDPRTLPQVEGDRGLDLPYDPLTTLVAEHDDGTRSFARGGDTFRGGESFSGPQVWRVPAPANTFRIGFVGDSTIYSRLPAMVTEGFILPTGQASLINFGVRSLASDRVSIVLRTALRQDLDLAVVYAGHNEYLDARLNPQSLAPFEQRERQSALLNSGLGRLLAPVVARLAPDPSRATARKGPREAELGAVSSEERARVLASYRRNLERMCDDAHAAGVPIVFVVPVSSLVHAPETRADDRKLAMGSFKQVEAALQAGDAVDWESALARVRESSPPWEAGEAWLAGMRAIAEGKPEAAVEPLRAARRLDEHPWRVEESRSAVIKEVAAGCGAPSILTEPGMLEDPRYLSPGDPLFVDQVHPSDEGRSILAAILGEALLPLLPEGTRWKPTSEAPSSLPAPFDPTVLPSEPWHR